MHHGNRLMRLWISGILAAAGLAAGEIIDRIAVTAGNTAITENEILREVRITAFLNGGNPDFSPAAKRQAAERMIEQELLRREINLSRFPPAQRSKAADLLEQIKSRLGGAARYRAALQSCGILEDELVSHLVWQLTVLRFTQVRFGSGNVDQQLDAWLKDARARTPVAYREEVFQ